MEQNPGVPYVGKEVFYFCRVTVRPLLDNSVLLPYLQKYEMLWDSEDVDRLTGTSPYCQLEDRFTSLVNGVEKQGEYGYMLLYMCIFESSSKALRHAAAVQHLDTMGKLWLLVVTYDYLYLSLANQKKTEPPWLRSGVVSPTLTGEKLAWLLLLAYYPSL